MGLIKEGNKFALSHVTDILGCEVGLNLGPRSGF